MVDKPRLQIIGWLFGGATAAVIAIAALLMTDAVASHPPADLLSGGVETSATHVR